MQMHFEDLVARPPERRQFGAPWALILAGGDGERPGRVNREGCSHARPRQYCASDGDHTPIEQAVYRARRLVREEQIVVATSRAHHDDAHECLAPFPRLRIVEQPAGRGTLPGLLLPLLDTMLVDPDATVLVMPADHHVADEAALARHLRLGIVHARLDPGQVILLGAPADRATQGCGWIVPGRPATHGLWTVQALRDNPPRRDLRPLVDRGALANTFVMVCTARTLAGMIRAQAPGWWAALTQGVCAPARLERAYRELPPRSFSQRVFRGHLDRLRLLPLHGASWDDHAAPEPREQVSGRAGRPALTS